MAYPVEGAVPLEPCAAAKEPIFPINKVVVAYDSRYELCAHGYGKFRPVQSIALS